MQVRWQRRCRMAMATGAAAGASSRWFEHVCYRLLKTNKAKDPQIGRWAKENLNKAAQQMTALAIGAAAGAVEWWARGNHETGRVDILQCGDV